MSWIRNTGRNAENYLIVYLFFVVSAELDDGADRPIILHVILADLPTKANLNISCSFRTVEQADLSINKKTVLWNGSVTFWYGSGSADPYFVLTDPDLDPDPPLFVSVFQDPTKNKFSSRIKSHKEVTKK
jgi:hypothetical protein